MKHFKKLLFLVAISISTAITYAASPMSVEEIQVVDKNTLEVTLSENPNMKVGIIDADINILSDIKLLGWFISQDSAKEVELLLEKPIMPNTRYSLLSVLGVDGSMDFTTPEVIDEYSETNTALEEGMQNISAIKIIDETTILISYTQELSASTFEYKLLAESDVVKVEKLNYDDPKLTITVEPPFISEQDYILMFIEMKDIDGNYIEFDTWIYDFKSPIIETETNIEENVQWSTNESEIIDLEAAGNQDNSETNVAAGNTEEVAMSAESTPDTGAQTWILVIITLVINTFYYSARRKKLSLA